ncbi:hypothetical protein [Devosia sp. Leaf420]|uniref:hypothetical protein n=1 Tax=Devosia sp. Leaf420 TaxID=1736374 RepID=UPI000A62F6C7|nr:hypothetical protein [Devosia sp. Leaf420]
MNIVKYAALALALCLAACSPTTLKSTFNATDAAFINQKGTGIITGQAFLRRNDGMVVYAAGSEVYLVPKTPIATNALQASTKAARSAISAARLRTTAPNITITRAS